MRIITIHLPPIFLPRGWHPPAPTLLAPARRPETRALADAYNREGALPANIRCAAFGAADHLAGAPGVVVQTDDAEAHTGAEVELVRECGGVPVCQYCLLADKKGWTAQKLAWQVDATTALSWEPQTLKRGRIYAS
jgi:hypothetical protein